MLESNSKDSPKKNNQEISLVKCLTECTIKKELTVLSINAGINAKRRLSDLGIIPGTIIIKKELHLLEVLLK